MAVDVTPRDAQSHSNPSPRRLLIVDQWVEAASGQRFDTLTPATGQTLADVAHGQAEDVDRAVPAARAAFASPSWAINTSNAYDAALPFGGCKQSGWGREMGEEALPLSTEVETVIVQL